MENYFSDKNQIYFAKTKDSAIIPTKRGEDAGYDLYACIDEDYWVFAPLETKAVPTGIMYAVDSSYYMQIEERSSTGKIGLKRNAGIVDSGFRGEIMVLLSNVNSKPIILAKTEKLPKVVTSGGKKYKTKNCIVYSTKKGIAQFLILPVPKLKTNVIDKQELLKISSERGSGMYGSSKK